MVLFILGLSSCRNVQTESKWLGLVSERVDKGPDWFSILLLVGGGGTLTYLFANVVVSKASFKASKSQGDSVPSTIPLAQSEPADSPAFPTSHSSNLVHGLRVFALFGLNLIRNSETDVWRLCGWLAAGISCVGLVIYHWKHQKNGKRDIVVITLSVIAILAGFAWALS